MSADTTADAIVRCPGCLQIVSMLGGLDPEAPVRCPRCKTEFQPRFAIPVKEGEAERVKVVEITPKQPPSWLAVWAFGLAIIVAGCALTLSFGPSIRGPEFLGYYLLSFVGIFGSQFLIRTIFAGLEDACLIGFLLFEGIGLTRYVQGSSAGMKKWELMFLMMAIGGVIFFLRAKMFEGVGSRGGSSGDCSSGFFSSCGGGSSGGSSCGGGGGCGGGGCGGCGGS